MKITIEAEPNEIAALVLAVQERQGEEFTVIPTVDMERAAERLAKCLGKRGATR